MRLTSTQVSKLRQAFTNGSSANIKISKTQLHKMRQSGGFLCGLLEPLLKALFLLIENVLKSLGKSISIALGLTAAAGTDAAIHKKIFGPGMHPSNLPKQAALIVSNEERNNVFLYIVKSFEELGW